MRPITLFIFIFMNHLILIIFTVGAMTGKDFFNMLSSDWKAVGYISILAALFSVIVVKEITRLYKD